MTTDPFTTAARAEGRVRADEWMHNNGGPQTTGHHIAHASIISGFRKGAEWARAHLAAQEPTDAEVRAVKIALIQDEYRVVPGNELVMIRQLGREGEYDGRARAALSAARAARRDEEKR